MELQCDVGKVAHVGFLGTNILYTGSERVNDLEP